MLKRVWEAITRFLLLKVASRIRWKLKNGLTADDHQKLKELLRNDYYVILTHRRNHLTTYLTSIGHFFVTGKLGFWSHSLMNLEDEVRTDDDFRLIESITQGVTYTPYEQVFNVDAVCVLKPRGIKLEQWTTAMDDARTYLGRKYDTLFDLAWQNKLSCVEVIHSAIKHIPGYKVIFADFMAMVEKERNLTPQMFRDSKDFEVVWEVKR